jgi:hypothetical protein
MQIVLDRARLRLHVDAQDTLHEEALETWREADALVKTCIDALPPYEADKSCLLLAETTTHALTAGRDDRVITDFNKVERQIRDADETLRATILNDGLAIFTICIVIGCVAGLVG